MNPSSIEKVMGPLPSDYRKFLENHTDSIFGGSYRLQEVAPIGTHGVIDYLHTVEDIMENCCFGFPALRLLCIGDNLFGCSTCLSLDEDRLGYVYYYDIDGRSYWDDERFYKMFPDPDPTVERFLEARRSAELPPKEPGFEDLYLASKSFTEFIEAVEPDDDDE